MRNLSVPIARVVSTQELQFPDDVEKQDGPFLCVECSERVCLRKGSVLRPHFAHISSTSHCGGGASETVIHHWAKRFVAKTIRYITFVYTRECGHYLQFRVRKSATARTEYTHVVSNGNRRYVLDVGVLDDETKTTPSHAIEIFHTHAVTDRKAADLSAEMRCLEVRADTVQSCHQSNQWRMECYNVWPLEACKYCDAKRKRRRENLEEQKAERNRRKK
jgi:hypothetical protein